MTCFQYRMHRLVLGLLPVCLGLFGSQGAGEEVLQTAQPSHWPRHTIDHSSRGADGIRLADINQDGHLDLVTGWEEGGQIRVAINPGPIPAVRDPWPSVLVGKVNSPEDAVFADLDRDGRLDVVSACEGNNRSVYVHWGPARENVHSEKHWTTESFPVLAGRQLFMFCLPLQMDGQDGIDLILGSKGAQAQVGWLKAPPEARHLEQWTWQTLSPAGWIMSLIAVDMDQDGDQDILLTDRRGPSRGCYWLENPGPSQTRAGTPWRKHLIGGRSREVMFAAVGDLDRDGLQDVVCAAKDAGILFFRRMSLSGQEWETREIPLPKQTGTGKGVQIDDLNQDGHLDLIVSCEHAQNRHGVFGLLSEESPLSGQWTFLPISGDKEGVKFDLIQLIDLDGDGDRDVLTCEERDNLGVIWYENPLRKDSSR